MKTISARKLKRGAPEEALAPGESLVVAKKNGKQFQVTRTGKRDRVASMLRIQSEIPIKGPRQKTDVVKAMLEAGL